MVCVRLYADWQPEELVEYDGWDLEGSSAQYVCPEEIFDVRSYLDSVGSCIREDEGFLDGCKRKPANAYFENEREEAFGSLYVYRVGDAVVFVADALWEDDDSPGNCPNSQNLRIRIYSGGDVSDLVRGIRRRVPRARVRVDIPRNKRRSAPRSERLELLAA